MRTKIGLLSSNRTAVIYSLQISSKEIERGLSRYSEHDLFETLLMIEYLLLKEMRRDSPNDIWVQRLERHLHLVKLKISKTRRLRLMKKIGLTTAFDANKYCQKLLFPWFR